MASPLYDAYKLAGKVLCHVDYRAGHGNCLITGTVPAYSANLMIHRDRLTGRGTSSGTAVTYSGITIPLRAITIIAKATRGAGSIGTTPAFIYDAKTSFRTNLSNNRLLFMSDGATTTCLSAIGSFLISDTKIIAVSRNGANPSLANFYVNGVLSGSANQSCGTITAGTEDLKVLRNPAESSEMFFCIIDEEMSAANILTLGNELNAIQWNQNPGGRIINPNGTTLYDFKSDWGVLQSVAAEGGVAGQFISNTRFQCYDTTGRFSIVRDTAGPNGALGKSIKATAATARKIYLGGIPGNTGTWKYAWWDNSASLWKDETSAIHGGTTDVEFTLDTNDRLWLCADSGMTYAMTHTL